MKRILKNIFIILIMCIVTGVVFAFTFDAIVQYRNTNNMVVKKYEKQVDEKKDIKVESNSNISYINKIKSAVFNINVKSNIEGYGLRNISSGSGVLYREDGNDYYIITNHHVISSGSDIYVNVGDEEVKVELLGSDEDTDIAVLRLQKKYIKNKILVPEIKQIKDLSIGENVFAIGNSLGYGQSVTKGIISALQRQMQQSRSSFSYKLIQTDAAINPGNSGGALVDAEGKLIGINVLKISNTGIEGMGFAIPIEAAINISNAIIKNGYLPKAFLGVGTVDLNLDMLEAHKLPKGVLVKKVEFESPAYNVGIRVDDLILKVDSVDVHTSNALAYEIRTKKPGDIVKIKVYTNNEYKTYTLKLGKTKK